MACCPFRLLLGVVCALIVRQPDLSTAGTDCAGQFHPLLCGRGRLAAVCRGAAVGWLGLLSFDQHPAPCASACGCLHGQTLRDPAAGELARAAGADCSGAWRLYLVWAWAKAPKNLVRCRLRTPMVYLPFWVKSWGCWARCWSLACWACWYGVGCGLRAMRGTAYGSLLALGITCWLAYQALINIAVITAVIPFTGIPLPFLSYGGSSLLFSLVGRGHFAQHIARCGH